MNLETIGGLCFIVAPLALILGWWASASYRRIKSHKERERILGAVPLDLRPNRQKPRINIC